MWPSTWCRIGSWCPGLVPGPSPTEFDGVGAAGAAGKAVAVADPIKKFDEDLLLFWVVGGASVSFFDGSEIHRLGFVHLSPSFSNESLPALYEGHGAIYRCFPKLICGPRNWEITSRSKGGARDVREAGVRVPTNACGANVRAH